ncbi:hypothetical protein EV652_101602 [Kribbella steppae]|uniref:Uncharacterized protein n=1 Tax=Kribbella steppae TaxID=2512223 RepID=A0A4R2HWP5_9ACTN|nr:hypothetical protein [Kribbella steppae]TCO35717.1 hypothetical protein EV652_101602 [Kribbella steppae]
MRSLVALIGTAGLVVSLAACGGSAEQPAGPQPAAPAGAGQQAGSPEQGQAGTPGQELAGIGSTLDAIDSELASDGSP